MGHRSNGSSYIRRRVSVQKVLSSLRRARAIRSKKLLSSVRKARATSDIMYQFRKYCHPFERLEQSVQKNIVIRSKGSSYPFQNNRQLAFRRARCNASKNTRRYSRKKKNKKKNKTLAVRASAIRSKTKGNVANQKLF